MPELADRIPVSERVGKDLPSHMIRYSWEQRYLIVDPTPQKIRMIEQALKGRIQYQSPVGFEFLSGTQMYLICQVIWFDHQIAPKNQIEYRVEFWLIDPALGVNTRRII